MEPHLTAAQQYFPTYKLDPDRAEIGLKEYELAAKALEADHRSLTAAAGIALFFGGGLATLFGSGGGVRRLSEPIEGLGADVGGLIALAAIAISLLFLHYFAQLQRSATYAARKIVVLRRLLGLDYGNIETVLPANRLDGANEPFAIEMFPGWRSLQAIPAIAVALIGGAALGIIVATFPIIPEEAWTTLDWSEPPYVPMLSVGVITTAFLLVCYRLWLLDDFETFRLYMALKLSGITRWPLKTRLGHVLYRLRLSVFEAERLGIDLARFHEILVLIEDRRYYRHNGNSVRAIAAAIYRYFRYGTRSGGSTIYQQLARSNFMRSLNASFRRKILEWILAPWLNGHFNKIGGLDAYLCSVRYAKGVIGLPEAMKHFFPKHQMSQPLSRAQMFVLIERLSNVSGTFPAARIERHALNARNAGWLKVDDGPLLNELYQRLGANGLIRLNGQQPAIDLTKPKPARQSASYKFGQSVRRGLKALRLGRASSRSSVRDQG